MDKKPMVGLLLWEGQLGGKYVVAKWVGFERNKDGYVIEALRRGK